MRLLYILNVANRVNNFSHSSMLAAKELGIEFHIAGNWGYKSIDELKADEGKYGIHIHQIDFIRNPFSLGNIKAYKQLNSLMKEWNFDAVHCNTPIGGLIGRISARKNKISPVIYQVHGFHFFKGAPLINWIVYYSMERFLSIWTDVLVTINEEDYEISKSKFNIKDIRYVHGVGVNTLDIMKTEVNIEDKRKEIGISKDDIVLLSVGELNKNKNQGVVIEAFSKIKNEKIHYFLVGKGENKDFLMSCAKKMNVDKNVHFLDYRNDVIELCMAADIFCFPSYREGLSVSVMEAMASGLPIVCSNIRGNVDLVKENEGGFLCLPTDAEGFSEKIEILANDAELRKKMGSFNLSAIGKFDMKNVTKEMRDIYCEVLYGGNKD